MSGHAITPSATRGIASGYVAASGRKSPMEASDDHAQAYEAADRLSREWIKVACQQVRSGGRTWYDTNAGFDDQEAVDLAYAWLLGRGTALNPPMVCCQAFPGLVRFEEQA